MSLATAQEVWNQIAQQFDQTDSNLTAAKQVTRTGLFYRNAREQTNRVDQILSGNWTFEPVRKTRTYSYTDRANFDQYAGLLLLEGPLLETSEVVDGDGTVLVGWDGVRSTYADADYEILDITDPTASPYTILRRLSGGAISRWQFTSSEGAYVSVEGFWGYRKDYNSQGFLDSQDALIGALTDSATTLTVTDVDGGNLYGDTPRFSPGNLIRVTTDSVIELMRVTATDAATNIVTVIRGVNGTTAIAHDADDTIFTWYPDPSIVRAVARQAAYAYTQMNGNFQIIVANTFSSVQTPPDLLAEVTKIIAGYRTNYTLMRTI